MKVSGVSGAKAAAPARKTAATQAKTGDEFSKHLLDAVDGVEEAQVVEAPVPVSAVDALLAVQEATDSTDQEARRRARRRLYERGESILDHLDELRHGLLLGTIPKERIIQLAQMVRGKRDKVDDPLLAQVLDEIELRAEVELAKMTPRDSGV
jgi:hypothetical protein